MKVYVSVCVSCFVLTCLGITGCFVSAVNKTDDEHCGKKIANGTSNRSEEYPWLVAIFTEQKGYSSFRCAGNLVTKKHIITAAHCVANTSLDQLLIVLGKHDIKNKHDGSTFRSIKEYHIHPEYRKLGDYDIAVVELENPVEYTTTIRSVCLWDENDKLDNIVQSTGTVVGWGKDVDDENWLVQPKQIEMPIVSQATCLRSDFRFAKLTSERTFCAENLSRTPCLGFSGSGLVMNRDGIWKLRGVAAVALFDPSTRLCDVNNYMVFSDVAKYNAWLRNVMI